MKLIVKVTLSPARSVSGARTPVGPEKAAPATPMAETVKACAFRLLSEKLDSVFTPASRPTAVRVSPPRPELRGAGWTACVKAELTSVTGKPLGTQTYRISISNGVIFDRRQVEADDTCATESYEPI